MQNPRMIRFVIEVPPELRIAVKQKAKAEKLPMSVAIRAMLEQWVEGDLRVKIKFVKG